MEIRGCLKVVDVVVAMMELVAALGQLTVLVVPSTVESATALINLLGRVKMAVSLSGSFDLAWKVLSCLLKPCLSFFVPRVVHV